MADTVGAMYVRVLSDTAGLKKQIEKEGKKSGEAFGREWDRAVTKEVNRGQFTDVVEREMRASARRTAKDWAAATSKGLKNQKVKFEIDETALANMQEAAKRLGLTFEKELGGAAFKSDAIAKYVRQAMKDVEREAAASEKRINDDRIRKGALYRKWQIDTERAYNRLRRDENKRTARDLEAEIRRTSKETARLLSEAWGGLDDASRKVEIAGDRLVSTSRRIRDEVSNDYGMSFRKAGRDVDGFSRSVVRMRTSLRRAGTGGWFDTMTNMAAALLGPLRAVTLLLKPFGEGFERLGLIFKRLGTRMGGFLKGLPGVQSAMKALAPLLRSPWTAAAAAILAMTAGLKFLNMGLGAMVGLVSAAAGILTMLASALYAAAANAVLLVPMVGALGVGLAGLVVGGLDSAKAIGLLAKAMNETDPKKRAKLMEQYNREIKKLGPNARSAMTELSALTKGFSDLKKNAGEALFKGMDKSLKAAKPLIKALEDGLVLVSGAVGDVIDKFLRLGEDSAFIADLGTMFKGTATIIKDLGGAAVDVFAGLTAMFSAIMPLVTDFTGSIGDAAENFRKWSQSEEGRTKILDWFTRAKEVGGQVWAIIKEVALAFHDLFTAGMESDETTGMLDTLLTKVQEFRETIRKAKEDGTLDAWFREAKETAKALWDTIVLVGGALKDLNTEENRAFLNNLITGIGKAINAFTVLTTIASAAFAVPMLFLRPFINLIGIGVEFVYNLITRFQDAKREGQSTFGAIKAAVQPFIDALKSAWEWIGKIITRVSQIRFPSIPSAFTSLAGKLFAAGGITRGPSIVGEAGPEMVIPLTRPLSQVDPSVRAIAAMLRGQSTDRVVTGGATGPTKIVNNDIKVYAPSADPEAVAAQVVNRSVAMAQ